MDWQELMVWIVFLSAVVYFLIKTIIDNYKFSKQEKAYALGTILGFSRSLRGAFQFYSYSFKIEGVLYKSELVLSDFPKNKLKNKNHIGDQFIVFFAKDNPQLNKKKVFLYDGEPLNEFNLVQPPQGWQSIKEIPVPLKINPYYIQTEKFSWSKIKEAWKNAVADAKEDNDNDWNELDDLYSVKRRKKSKNH